MVVVSVLDVAGGGSGVVEGDGLVGGEHGLGEQHGLDNVDGSDVVDGGGVDGGVSGVSDLGDESALAINVVLDSADSAVGLHQTVLSLGLVTLAGLLVRVDVVGVVVVDGVLVGVVGLVSLKDNFLLEEISMLDVYFSFVCIFGRVCSRFFQTLV
jgi:hypothetical protein